MSIRIDKIELVGGRLCLDFINTTGWYEGGDAEPPPAASEMLKSYDELLAWSRRVGLIGPFAQRRLGFLASATPEIGRHAVRQAHDVRQTMRGIFMAPSAPSSELREAFGRLSAARPSAEGPGLRPGRPRLSAKGEWSLDPGLDPVGWLLTAVYGSSMELLTSDARHRMSICPAAGCGRLFVDDSPGGRRKWCSMKTCGNRQKARNHYRRHR